MHIHTEHLQNFGNTVMFRIIATPKFYQMAFDLQLSHV